MFDISTVSLILGSSVSAALLTQGISAVRDRRGKRTRSKLSGLHLALQLEAYGRKCSNNLGDYENYLSSEGQAGSQAELVPDLPPYGENIDWMALGIATAMDAFQFRVDIEQANVEIASIADYQDSEDALSEALSCTASLGLKAFDLAATTMRQSGIPHANREGRYSSREHLQGRAAYFRQLSASGLQPVMPEF